MQTGPETVGRVVGEFDAFLLRLELAYRQHRSEDLFLNLGGRQRQGPLHSDVRIEAHDLHIGGDIGEDCGRKR